MWGVTLLDPVKSNDPTYITRKIREQLKGTSVTVVLIGHKTWQSDWVEKEVRMSLDKSPPNGVVGIRLKGGVKTPESLRDCGAEVIDWQPDEFEAAFNRAALASGRALVAAAGPGGGSSCAR